jgi:hypothetical protein
VVDLPGRRAGPPLAILIDLPHTQRNERPCRRPGMDGEAATLFTMSNIERVRRIGGNEADMANLQNVIIGTNKEPVNFPFDGGSLRFFNGDQIVDDLPLLARQLPAATADGVALLELPDFTLRRCVDEPIEIVVHGLSRDWTENVHALFRQPDINRLGLCRASLICEPGNLQIAPFRIVAGEHADAYFGAIAADKDVSASYDAAPGYFVRYCLSAK